MRQHGPEARAYERSKRADTTSVVGAAVLGAGVALLMSQILRPFAIELIVVGVLMHSWGMFEKRRLEDRTIVRVWWTELLFWTCWAALLSLAVYVAWIAARRG